MSTHPLKASPDTDPIASRLDGDIDPGELDEPVQNPILCCGQYFTTPRRFWKHYFTTHDTDE